MSKRTGKILSGLIVVAVILSAVLAAPPLAGRLAYAVERGKNEAVSESLQEGLARADSLSTLFRAVAKAVTPAVVEIRIERNVTSNLPEGFPEMPFGFPFGRNPIPFRPAPRTQKAVGLGSGVIIDAENGYILTNNHVVGNADKVSVVLANDREVKAEWVRTDPRSDLAVVKIAAENLISAPLGDSSQMEVGDWVMAIGSPQGLSQTVTVGIVSAKGRHSLAGLATYQDFIQTDAAINRGNSGGPLVNMKGEVIGINNAIASSSGGNDGIGFAIPSNMAREVVQQLIEKGSVERGFLGVGFQDLDARVVESFKLPDTNGVLVTTIVKDSPAEKNGLRIGDVVTEVDGQAITNGNDFRNIIARIRPETKVTLGLYRNGEKISVDVTLTARPNEPDSQRNFMEREAVSDRYGVTVGEIPEEYLAQNKELKGVLVTSVEMNSDAAEQGLTAGMVITHVQNTPVGSVSEFDEAIGKIGEKDRLILRVETPQGGAKLFFIEPIKS